MKLDLAPYFTAIEAELKDVLDTTDAHAALMFDMMRYHMGWLDENLAPLEAPRGKRLRPAMCLLSCEAVAGQWKTALPAAGAIELIHNFSLIHDDIQDISETRRHRPTVWKLWGVPQAINTGDAMWTMSRLCCYRMADRGLSNRATLAVVRLLDETCLKLCTGQHLDMGFEERDDVTLDDYMAMIDGKTAALLSASLACGAVVGGGTSDQVEAMAAFGRELGITFQIVDDILGIWGDPAVTGKSVASDVITRKKTLPVLYALNQEDAPASLALRRIYAEEDISLCVPEVLALLEDLGARDYAEVIAAEHQFLTMSHLGSLELDNSAIDALRDLAESLLNRTA